MSNTTITWVVGAVAAVLVVATFAWLVLTPALGAFTRAWERVVAGFLSLYVLAVMIGLGVLGGAGIVLLWEHLS